MVPVTVEVKRASKNLLDNSDFNVLMTYISDVAADDVLSSDSSNESEVLRNLTRYNAVNDIPQLMRNL